MYPSLLNSRSLGDLLGHQIGVNSEPSIKIHDILSGDKLIVMGTSAVWETMTPEDVLESIADLGVKDKGTFTEVLFNAMME